MLTRSKASLPPEKYRITTPTWRTIVSPILLDLEGTIVLELLKVFSEQRSYPITIYYPKRIGMTYYSNAAFKDIERAWGVNLGEWICNEDSELAGLTGCYQKYEIPYAYWVPKTFFIRPTFLPYCLDRNKCPDLIEEVKDFLDSEDLIVEPLTPQLFEDDRWERRQLKI